MSSGISGDLAGGNRLLLESMGKAAETALFPGQRLPARVIEMLLTGDVLLELGRSRTTATVPTSTPLQPGDRVRLEVVTAGPTPEFRIVSDTPADRPMQPGERVVLHVVTGGTNGDLPIATNKTAVTPQAPTAQPAAQPTAQPMVQPSGVAAPPAALTPRDLPVIMRALAEMAPNIAPNGGSPIAHPAHHAAPAAQAADAARAAQAGQTFLRAAAAADLHPAVVEQIQRMLGPLHAALPPAELAPMLRAFLAQSGLFTENHLGAALRQEALQPQPSQPQPLQQQALQQQPGTIAADQQQPLTADQRQPIAGDQRQPATADQRQPIAFEQRQPIADVRLLLGALTTADTPVPDAIRVFGEALLHQQLVVAEQLAATGSGQISIPFMFGEEQVDIRFTWDREAREETQERSEQDGDRAISLGVFVNLHIFGAIEARIVWKPESFAVTFYVEREATRAIVEARLTELSTELSASGFSGVATNVWLNPDRVSAGVTPVRPAIRAGTILDVMA